MQLVRSLALGDDDAIARVMAADLTDFGSINAPIAAIVPIVALAGVQADFASYRPVIDRAIAAGTTDEQVMQALLLAAPILGVARVTSALHHVMAALDLA